MRQETLNPHHYQKFFGGYHRLSGMTHAQESRGS